MQMFSAGGECVCECVCVDPESGVFWAGGGRKHAMFVYAGPWPGPIVTTAVAGGMLPWCVFLCVHVCIFNCQRKCEQSNILVFFSIYFLCARREHITCMLCSENITKGPVCVCARVRIWGALTLTTPNICPDSITNDEVPTLSSSVREKKKQELQKYL